jgi:hypothetical protein
MSLGKIIFGDNQFLGVNHSSQHKASKLYDYYSSSEKIIETLAYAYDAGIRDFMFTTHDRYELVFSEIDRSNIFPEMNYYPCIPYAHKYWNQLMDNSLAAVIASTISKTSASKLPMALLASISGRHSRLIETIVLLENLMCNGLNVKGVFLQNAAFDLLLAMKAYNLIDDFYSAIDNRLGILPGFITMNHSLALSTLTENIGIEKPVLCANFNLSGSRMHPSFNTVKKSFASKKSINIAMSIFGSGANPNDSLDFAIKMMKSAHVDSILFGSSNAQNIRNNAQRIFKSL